MSSDNLKEALSVSYQNIDELEQDKTYPFYGIITSIVEENSSGVISKFEVNQQIVVSINIQGEDPQKFSDTIKSRMFEPGIFLGKFLGTHDEKVLVDCNTIVFGKRGETSVQ